MRLQKIGVSALAAFIVLMAGACDSGEPAPPIPPLIEISQGDFIAGSDETERQLAYALDEAAYGHSVTREQGWYDGEMQRQTWGLPAFSITTTLITNKHYAAFVNATGHPMPDVTRENWESYGLIHPFQRTRRHAWRRGEDGTAYPPDGRDDHPVVLVTVADAVAYADWLTERTGQIWRLPTRLELEKASRGNDGRHFPWGNRFDPSSLNSHDAGPFDTQPVGSYPDGASPYGLLDAAGQVFEWTSESAGDGQQWVKGAGSWDDKGCGICRPAAQHTRPVDLKHILIGFRLVRDNKSL